MDKQNFYDLNFDQLKNFLIEKVNIENNKAKMRAQQMFNAVYKKNIKNFDELTTFNLNLREKIKELISLAKPKIADIQKSKDGTIKFLLELRYLSESTISYGISSVPGINIISSLSLNIFSIFSSLYNLSASLLF